LISLTATAFFVREARTRYDREAIAETARAVRSAIGSRPLWVAAAFIFLWNFSPSFGVPLEYHLVDNLGFSKIFLGTLDSLGSAAAIVGAAIFGKICRRLPMRRLLNLSIAIGVASTLAYWGLVGPRSAIALTVGTGAISMIASLATYDLAARSCPDRAEGTFFAALMSIANIGTAGSAFVGGRLYDWLGLNPLILVSGLATAACWLIVPLIRIDSPPSPPESATG
jgi:predicted MFS family arabinose efflux permease